MAKRRAPGTGSVYERASYPAGTKRWVAEILLGYAADDKKLVKSTYHHTKTQASRAATSMAADFHAGRLKARDRRATVAAQVPRWLAQLEERLARKTYVEYKRYAETVIVPALGSRPLAEVTRAEVRDLFADQAARSIRWREMLRATGHKLYADAIEEELVDANPFDKIRLPSTKRKRLIVWTPDQVKRFLEAVVDDPDRMLYALAILTGARAGELFALQPGDADEASGTLTIGRSVSRALGGFVLKEPKTDDGWRTIRLHPLGFLALRRQAEVVAARRTLAGARWHERGLIFPNRYGDYRDTQRPREKLQRLCRQLELPVLTFHGLRHLHASLLILVGAHGKEIQAQLGHASYEITMNVYSHLIPGVGAEGALRVGDLLVGSSDSLDQPL